MSKTPDDISAANDEQFNNVRICTFFAVVCSTVAMVTALVTLPLLYNYVQHLQTFMVEEAEFCRVSKVAVYFC